MRMASRRFTRPTRARSYPGRAIAPAPCGIQLMQRGRRPKQLGLNPLHGGDAGGHCAVDVSGRSVRQAEPEAAEVDQRGTLVVIGGRAGGLEAGHPVCAPWSVVPRHRFLACGCALELGGGLANSPA